MKTLKKIISRYMYRLTGILVVMLLIAISVIQLISEQRMAYKNATRTFAQIEQVLEENQKELEEVRVEYRNTCIHNAEVVARIVDSDPEILNDVEELKKVAASLEIDEIHIFDKTGRIFTGTCPEYFGFTFDSGEQMEFFKPMLEDKTLKLVQAITPNTAEGKLMQYSACWNDKGDIIVQVGMEPGNVTKATEKNELSYIFSLFRINPRVNYYAIDTENGEIVGSTDVTCVGSNLTEIGLSLAELGKDEDGFQTKVSGKHSFCVFEKMGSNYVGYVIASRELYQRVPSVILILFACLLTIALILARAVIRHMNKYVVEKIQDVNEKLKSISNGNLEETIDIQSSMEFFELSNYINAMVKSLLENNKKMSYVLSKTNLYIGVYEYNKHMKKIRFTEYIPRILCLSADRMGEIADDIKGFKAFLDEVRENPVPDEEGVFKIGEYYVKLEEINQDDEVFGVAIDVTEEVLRRREIEEERDMDLLTGLYNRRGLDIKLSQLFHAPEKLLHSVMLMIDADGLKTINDTYGHEKGDVYLKKIAEILNNFGLKSSVAARQGGDEFVLFLYGYGSEEELKEDLEKLIYIQNNTKADLDKDLRVELRFSVGYALNRGDTDYSTLLKEADQKMYNNKLERKKLLTPILVL